MVEKCDDCIHINCSLDSPNCIGCYIDMLKDGEMTYSKRKNYHPADCPGKPKWLPKGEVPNRIGDYILKDEGVYKIIHITNLLGRHDEYLRHWARKGARFAPIQMPEGE